MKFNYSAEQQTIIDAMRSGTKRIAGKARAGTGKSATGCGIIEAMHGRKLAYIQFMKRGQLEMQNRITDSRCEVLTFNAVCNRFITRKWGFMRAQNFWPEANRVATFDASCKGVPLNQVCELVKKLKCEMTSLSDLANLTLANKIALKYGIEDCANKGYPLDKIVEMALKVLTISLESRPKDGKIAWEDQIFIPLLNDWVTPQFDGGILDEAQDFNPIQHAAALLLFTDEVGILGDDRQQIYAWRGAVNNGFDTLCERFNARVFPLTESYRCPSDVVKLSQSIVPDFRFHPNAIKGNINSAMPWDCMLKQANTGNSILSRTNAPLMPIALQFIRENKTARVEGKDIGGKLAGIVRQCTQNKSGDIIDFMSSLEEWKNARVAKAQGFNAQQIIESVCDDYETLKVLGESCNSVPHVLNRIESLFEDTDGNSKPAIVLSTVHKAKGLEWPTVFVLAETFNRKRPPASEAQKIEEENIKYVCWTRTKENLNFVQGTKAQQP